MNVNEINTRLSAIVRAMSAKGLSRPKASFWIENDAEFTIHIKWMKDAVSRSSFDEKYDFMHADTPEAVFEKVEKWVDDLPSPEQAKFNEFMGAVAKAVDLGREHGIDVEYVNPLAETLKRLSENALTFRGEAA